jgi:hypothetical protein
VPAVYSKAVSIERRPHTEEPDEIIEISSEELLAKDDPQLIDLLIRIGVTPPHPPVRDKMINLIMKMALSARDS